MTGLHKHQPAPGSVHFSHLIDMGAALAGACTDLARDPTPERCDRLIMKLRGAGKPWGSFAGHWWLMESWRMVLTETIFVNGQPVGQIRENVLKGVVTFQPKHGHASLAGRTWRSVDSCQRAVLTFYKSESPR